MSAEAMTVPPGEVHLDGRIYYMDGTYSGTYAAGQVVRGDIGLPPLVFGRVEVEPADTRADVYWFETFMERLMRDVEKRAPAGD